MPPSDINLWVYSVEVEKNRFAIEELITDFMRDVIEPRKQVIKRLASSCECTLNIVEYIYEGCNPNVHLNKSTLKTLTNIGAEIHVDAYVLTDA